MNNWKEYIEHKFIPKEDFVFEDKTELKSGIGYGTLTITHNQTGNWVCFIFPSENWNKLDDVQFGNNRTEGWSGEYLETVFSEVEKDRLDQYLSTVYKTGWSSIDYYLNSKHFKSYVFRNQEFNGEKFTYYSSSYGCISTVLFPIFWIVSFLIKIGIFGRIDKVKLDSINK